jgi:hypothetical protein
MIEGREKGEQEMKIEDQGGAVHIQIYRWVPQACALYMPAP